MTTPPSSSGGFAHNSNTTGTMHPMTSPGRAGVNALRCLTVFVSTLFPVAARCGAPFQTDDPGVAASGRIELLSFYQSTLAAEARTGALPGLEMHFGMIEGVELDVTTPVAFNTPSTRGTQRAFGDTSIGLKYRLIPESDKWPLISLVPKITVPTGNASRGLGNGASQLDLAVAAQVSRGGFQTYANIGYWANNGSNNRNYWFLGVQAQYALSPAWIVGAEIFHTTAQTLDESPRTGFNIGGYYVVDPNNQVLFSAGRGLQNARQTNRVSVYVGYQIGF
jgi:hypothetical protein